MLIYIRLLLFYIKKMEDTASILLWTCFTIVNIPLTPPVFDQKKEK